MSNKELKSVAYATENNLADSITANDTKGIDVAADIYETHVLNKCGITVDQLKKKQKLDAEFLPASVYVGGNAAETQFKADPELSEVSMTIPMGGNQTMTAIFTRGQQTVVAVNSKIETAEMKRVLMHVDSLWDDVSS